MSEEDIDEILDTSSQYDANLDEKVDTLPYDEYNHYDTMNEGINSFPVESEICQYDYSVTVKV